MKTTKILSYLLGTSIAMGTLTGCMDDPVPTSGATQEQIEQASKDGLANAITKYFNTGSNSSYSDIGYGQQMIYRDVMTADMPVRDPSYYYFVEYIEPLYIGDYQLQTDFWQRYYYLIKKCNICVGACSDSADDALNLATALTYRALAYLDLMRWYEFHDSGVSSIDADAAAKGIKGLTVPIVTENTTELQSFANPRAPFHEMYRFILSDLNRAERAMSKVSQTPELNKPSLATVQGMKARLWLEIATRFRDYPEDLAEQIANDNVSYENVLGPGYALDPLGVTTANDAYRQAVVYAQKVIDSGATPVTEAEWHSVTSGFNTPTSAWLFAILMSSSDVMVTSYTWQSWVSFMAPEAKYGVSSPEFAAQHKIDRSLYESMSDDDWRKRTWIDPDIFEAAAADKSAFTENYGHLTSMSYEEWLKNAPYVGFKFRPGSGERSSSTTGNKVAIPLMRVEEMHFILAEAKGNLNGVGSGVAALNSFMNTYRYKQATYNCVAGTLEDFTEELIKQKRIEFWGEGISLWDIRRLRLPVTRGYEGSNHLERFRFNSEKGYVPGWSTMYIPRRENDLNSMCKLNPDPSSKFTLWVE